MTDLNPNTNTLTNECQHPSNRIILTQEGEYVCGICGVVLTLDQAAERRVYANREVVGYLDPHGKTNPWLLGLGSVISSGYLCKVAKRRKVNNEYDSIFANIIVYLELERYGQELMDSYHAYSKSNSDYSIATYLAIKRVDKKHGLNLEMTKVKEIIERTYNSKVQFVSDILLDNYCRLAKRIGAKRARKLLKKVII